MIVERSMHPTGCRTPTSSRPARSGDAFFVDAGGPVEPLIEKADEHGLNVTHVLLTHHHHDHVAELDALTRALARRRGAHPPRRARPRWTARPATSSPTTELEIGGLTVRTLHTPGHTAGMLSLLVDGTDVFTGDTLFKGSVGGVRAPGHTTYDDLKHSIMDVLLALPPETTIHPGHTDPTTVGDELEANALRAHLARPGPRGRQRMHGAGRDGDARAARRRLRRRAQGVGPLARRRATTSSPARQVSLA